MAPKRESSPPLPGDGQFSGDFSDKKRAELVRSDGARKRLARQWTNLHLPVPHRVGYRAAPLFDRIRREREEELRRRARQRNGGEGSSAAAPMEEPPLLPPPADFVSDEQLDATMEAALQRSVVEAKEAEKTAKLNAELSQHLLETAIVISTPPPVIDLVSDSDEE